MTGVIAIIMVFSIPLSAIIGYFCLQSQKLNAESGGGGEAVSDLRKQVGSLMAENEDMKDRLKNIEYILGNESKRISLDYEKEQILMDKQNKFNQ